ncbi:unnamed protein product, partial [Iphiclides podalirius]
MKIDHSVEITDRQLDRYQSKPQLAQAHASLAAYSEIYLRTEIVTTLCDGDTTRQFKDVTTDKLSIHNFKSSKPSSEFIVSSTTKFSPISSGNETLQQKSLVNTTACNGHDLTQRGRSNLSPSTRLSSAPVRIAHPPEVHFTS